MKDSKNKKIDSNYKKPLVYRIVFFVIIIFVVIVLIKGVQKTFIESSQDKNPNKDKICEGIIIEYQKVQLYAENFLAIKVDPHEREENKIIIEGSIKNNGKLGLNNIELTAFVIDDTMKILREHTHTASSPDGKPLWRHERRHFKFKIEATQNTIILLITKIDFATKWRNDI
jgi:hypothetical protein